MGGGDSAIEAAVALASQGTNRVPLSYRKGEFSRIKDRNLRGSNQEKQTGRLEVLLHFSVREIREYAIVLEAGAEVQKFQMIMFLFLQEASFL